MQPQPPRPNPQSEMLQALRETAETDFDVYEPPVNPEWVHVSPEPQDLLGDEFDDLLGVAPAPEKEVLPSAHPRTPVLTPRDQALIEQTRARLQANGAKGSAPLNSASTAAPNGAFSPSGTPAGTPDSSATARAQKALETPGFEGVRPAEKNPASVINLVTRGRMPAGERLRAYLADLSPEESAALRAFMDDYKMNADSPEIVTAMLMGHIAKVAHVIPNQIDLQVQQAADHLHGALAAYANVPQTIQAQIDNFKAQASESTLALTDELYAFKDAFHDKMKEDLGKVLGEYFSNLERLDEIVQKHKALLEVAGQEQVKASTEALQQVEKQLEHKFKKEIGAALLSASQDIKALAKTHTSATWIPYALSAGAFGLVLGIGIALLLK